MIRIANLAKNDNILLRDTNGRSIMMSVHVNDHNINLPSVLPIAKVLNTYFDKDIEQNLSAYFNMYKNIVMGEYTKTISPMGMLVSDLHDMLPSCGLNDTQMLKLVYPLVNEMVKRNPKKFKMDKIYELYIGEERYNSLYNDCIENGVISFDVIATAIATQ